MKSFFGVLTLTLLLTTVGQAGPWYTLDRGHEYGDKVQNEIELKDRIYFFRRPTDSEGKRSEDDPIKIIKASPDLTLGTLVKELQKSFPTDFPKKYLVIVLRADNPNTGYWEDSSDVIKSKRLLQARDVIWIGYSK